MTKPLMKKITLVTGPRGSGKTTWCQRSISIAKENGLYPAGLLSPAIIQDAKKIGIDLLNVVSGEQRPLARKCTGSSQKIRWGDWCFEVSTLDWGNQILRTLLDHDLIFLDELGPLEFEKGLGLQDGLRLIDEGKFTQAYVVIRPELVNLAQNRWPDAKVTDISLAKLELQELIEGTA